MLALFSRSDTYHTIKHYWQLHSKLHLWFVCCVSRTGNPKSASGTALLFWVGNISDSHQSLLISDYNGDQTWKWKCSCCRAGVGTNHFSTDATGKIDYNHSPVSCASWIWFPFNLYTSDGAVNRIEYNGFQIISNLYFYKLILFKNQCLSRRSCHVVFHCATVKTHGHPLWITTAYTCLNNRKCS